MNLLMVLLALGFGTPSKASADTITPLQYSTTTAPLIIEAYAVRYGIPAAPIIKTLQCESQFDSQAIGDHGTSFGVAQIHLSDHPGVTKEEALNPYFAIDWTVRQFRDGNASWWSCYRKMLK